MHHGMNASLTVSQSSLLDELFSGYQQLLKDDYKAYRNHCLRVFNFCCALSGSKPTDTDKIAVAVFFHDLGIWTEHTFDYLAASQHLSRLYLEKSGRSEWQSEIDAMIGQHHKLTRYKKSPEWLVEPFRKADWIDMSGGMLRFKLPDDFVTDVLEAFPNAGFHKKLFQLAIERLKTHPFSPLPMVKL
jgi:hypothetical protein